MSHHTMFWLLLTNKAAREMKERVQKLVGDQAEVIWMSTFQLNIYHI